MIGGPPWLTLVWLVAVLALAVGTGWRGLRGNRHALLHAAVWLAVALTLALFYRLFLGP